ncbi:MAG: IscS subfamily cysteine desulfurase [Ectobacillus sp.]
MIYMDYAATTPMSDEALSAYSKAAKDYFGNEQSLHDIGSNASTLLHICKKTFASFINGKEQGVFFTSGGSESNCLALHSLIAAHTKKGKHIITTPIEHASIHNYFRTLEQHGFTVAYVPVDRYGIVDLKELEAAITDETIIASIQHGNSEIGTCQPLQEIGAILKKYNVLFHTDCVQTFGKLPIDVQHMQIDSLSVSSHKIYGPKGVGACYINPQVRWKPLFAGTSHEGGFRPGTVNVPGIAAFLTAAQHIMEKREAETARLQALRQRFIDGVQMLTHPIFVEGHPVTCLPHIAAITIKGIEGQYMVLEYNRNGIAISTGSACQITKQEPSRTLLAIGRSPEEAKQYVRFSFGKSTTEEHIDTALHVLKTIIDEFFRGAIVK